MKIAVVCKISIVILGLVLATGTVGAADGPIAFPEDTLTIETASDGKHKFTVELARSEAQIRRGLMYRQDLAPDRGMLFIYPHVQRVAMWMKNTFVPLDMLFIDAKGRIVKIAERTIPQSLQAIPGGQPVLAVLELRGGTSDRIGIAVGDMVRHPTFRESH